ncbi:hypothetical protein GGI24_003340 [Coemansia furcata]|nr:hypothetical protein GGI24_003340 [Coemansia furcata]
MRVSLLLSVSFLVFWISVLGSTSSLLSSWRSTGKALSPRVFELLLWSQIPTYQWSSRRRSASLTAEPSGTRGRAARSDHGGAPSDLSNRGGAAATTTLLAPLSRPTALKPDAMLSKWAAAVANEKRMGQLPGWQHPQSKLGGNGSSDEGQQTQRPVDLAPPPATASSPYKLSSNDIGIEIKPLSGGLTQLRRHEPNSASLALKDGRRKVSRRVPAAKPMSGLLYRGRSYSTPSDIPVAPSQDDVVDSSPMPTGDDLEADEMVDRLSQADCAPAAHRPDVQPVRRPWLLATRSATPPRSNIVDSGNTKDMLDAHLPASALYRKRALALRRASGSPTKTLVAPEELTASAILPEEPNGITSMIAISTVLIFATFVAF